MFYSELTDRLFCVGADVDSMAVLRGDGSGTAMTFTAGTYPYCFAYSRPTRRLYVGCLSGTKVYVIKDTAIGIAEQPSVEPTFAARLSVAPNPFRDQVRLRVADAAEHTSAVQVFAIDGRLVRNLAVVAAGTSSSTAWDGRDETGVSVSAGTYIAVLKGGEGARAMLVKQ
jgi:hypothetical protein